MIRNSIIKNIFAVIFIFTISINAQTVKLKIIETSDVHGTIYPYDFRDAKDFNSSLAHVSTFVKEERNKKDQEVILLDNGDILQGQPAVYYFNFEKTDVPNLYARAMNFMKYDAGGVGNHDIETGHPVYDKFNKEINFPWLAANAVHKNSGKPYFKPYTIINKKGVKVAVLGLITPAIPKWLPEQIWEGMEFNDMIESAKFWVNEIKQKENPDVLIGLFHAGVDYDYNNQKADDHKNENASKLIAQQVAGFDIVFVGHDHKIWNYFEKGPNGNEVLIMGPTSGARNVAATEVVLNYDKESKSWDIVDKSGEIVEMKNFKADEEFMNKFQNEFEEVKKYVSKEIGEFTKTITTKESMFGNSDFVDLIHKIQLEITDADISFAAPLAFNTSIDSGKVYVKDMFNLYRYENLLYTMQLSGKEIKDYLEYSYANWFNTMKNENDNLLKFKKDEKGNLKYSERNNSPELAKAFYNFSSAAGINYVVDVSKPEGEKVTITSMADGSKFDLDKNYKVAVNSYRGNGGGGHLTEGAKIHKDELSKRILTSTDKDLRFYLMKWIEQKKVVNPEAIGNWKVVPETWHQKGKEKDFKLLYD